MLTKLLKLNDYKLTITIKWRKKSNRVIYTLHLRPTLRSSMQFLIIGTLFTIVTFIQILH